jgi:hypothetical protein
VAFKPPTFNLVANVWLRLGTPTTLPPGRPADTQYSCQLYLSKTHLQLPTTTFATSASVLVLFPARTDVRGSAAGGQQNDLLEVPAASGRFYAVRWVEDRAKGFTNEYRVAGCLQQVQVTGGWPFPTP